MKITPMLFAGDMVRALIEGRKVQTRRPVPAWQLATPLPEREDCISDYKYMATAQLHHRLGFGVFGETEESCMAELAKHTACCPFGRRGDLIYVRETTEADEEFQGSHITAAIYSADKEPVLYSCSDNSGFNGSVAHWDYPRSVRPSIHMRRWESRLTLKITNVRVERIKDISTDDIMAEGVQQRFPKINDQFTPDILKGQFMDLWESVYGDKSWHSNPWCWVLDFEVIHRNIDAIETTGER